MPQSKETYNAKKRSKYYENKEKELERMKQFQSQQYTCECGKTLTKGAKSRHEKTKKHLKYIEENKTNKDYYYENKVLIDNIINMLKSNSDN